jgi:Putative Flp pilus-assembly TadE/G-like
MQYLNLWEKSCAQLQSIGAGNGARTMSGHKVSPLQKILKDERGQMLPLVAFMLVALLGMTGFVIDTGRAYIGYRQLQASTDAAALAATQYMPNTTNATAAAVLYGGATGGKNAVTSLKNVAMVSGYPQYKCLTVSVNLACLNSTGGTTGGANVIVVKQTGTVNTTFGALIGFKTFTVTATATASMGGAVAPPYNVAIVVDTTASMQGTDNDSSCASTRISCAINGIQILLQNMNPCIAADAANCGSAVNGNVSHPVDKVAIFTYPNITVGTVSADTNCGSSSPTAVAYSFPTPGLGTYSPGTGSSTPTYQVVNYSSDYKTSDSTNALNSASNLSAALGAGPSTTTTTTSHGRTTTTTTPCSGMQAPGGEGTFFAGAIYAAQASLVAAQTANSQAQNVMIILSDGDACAGSAHGCPGNASAMAGASTTLTTYPALKDQCQQAVTAAAAAKTAGTKVYTVAYGAAASGCASDSPAITPCQTMQRMAYDASTFFSDYTATGSGTGSGACISAAEPIAALPAIFTKISGSLTLPRLIPDNAQ